MVGRIGSKGQRYKSSVGSKLFDFLNYLLCIFLVLLCIYPFLYMFSLSVSNYVSIAFGDVRLFPKGFHMVSYQDILRRTMVLRGYFNTILYTVVNTFLVIMLSSMGGFVLAERKFFFKRSMSFFFLIMMFFSGGMIPVFLWIRNLGLLDTIWAIVLPTAVGPFYIFLFRVYIKENVPESLKESVRIDGGNDFVVYMRIVLPLIKPIIATIGLFAAVAMWNSFVPPLIYLHDSKKYPLTLLLRQIVIVGDFGGYIGAFAGRVIASPEDTADAELWTFGYMKSIKMAMTMITVIPIVLVYPFAQRYFVRGILIGSLKE